MGTAHAGHDQCARCYFDYIKPALQAERAEVKRRKELKRLHLSPENRKLINGVDLKEPQMVDHPDPPLRPISIQRAVSDVLIDKMLAGKTEEQQLDTLLTEMIREETAGLLPPDIRPVQPVKSAPKEELPVQNTDPEPVLTRHVHAGGSGSRLSEGQVKEVIDAYQDGMVVNAICDVCNIATTTLYAIVREYGIPFRTSRTRPIHIAPPRPPLRRPVMPQSTPLVSPPKVEPAPSNGVVSGLTEWVVTYTVTRTETTIVAARSFNDAAATVTDGDVISVAKKLP